MRKPRAKELWVLEWPQDDVLETTRIILSRSVHVPAAFFSKKEAEDWLEKSAWTNPKVVRYVPEKGS